MPKVLIVEDNEMNRDMLTRRLQRQGFTICSAPDGPSGIAMAGSEKPDLILMDVALGDIDGWEATQIIKSQPSTASIPVIALTAHALASDREKSVEVGCADFDTKPIDLPRLLQKIDGCLNRPAPISRAEPSRENPSSSCRPCSGNPARASSELGAAFGTGSIHFN